MAKIIRFPLEELIIEGTLAFTEVNIRSSAFDVLPISGAPLSAELVLESGYVQTVGEIVYLVSRNTEESLISRVDDDRLISRRVS